MGLGRPSRPWLPSRHTGGGRPVKERGWTVGRRGAASIGAVALLAMLAGSLAAPAVATDTVAIAWVTDAASGPVVHRDDVPADQVVGRLAALRARADVRVAEVDRPVAAQYEPLRDLQWNLDRIRIDGSREHAPRADGQVLAVLDTGVDATHPDLEGVVLPGWDALGQTDGRTDAHGHGTHVAGIAAALADNGREIAGVAPGLAILPVRVLDDAGLGAASDVAAGIHWAVANGATIVNLSLGSREPSDVLADAVRSAVAQGVVVVAAAGNLSDDRPVWPAAMREVIGVTATDDADGLPPFASHGTWVDLAAPGTGILSLHPTPSLRTMMSGTSMAAPLVAGVAALLRAREPELTPAMVRSRLVYTSEDIGAAGRDGQFGYGLLAADVALRPVPTFADVTGGAHAGAIRELVADGITGGCAAERFCPGAHVTRGQIASFLTRALRLAPATTAADYTDTAGTPHAPAIDALAAAGITTGPATGAFEPQTPITRGEVAVLLASALELTTDVLPPFTDVAHDSPYAAAIAATTDAGITTGCAADRFCPDAPLTRAQMASLLGRAFLGVRPATS